MKMKTEYVEIDGKVQPVFKRESESDSERCEEHANCPHPTHQDDAKTTSNTKEELLELNNLSANELTTSEVVQDSIEMYRNMSFPESMDVSDRDKGKNPTKTYTLQREYGRAIRKPYNEARNKLLNIIEEYREQIEDGFQEDSVRSTFLTELEDVFEEIDDKLSEKVDDFIGQSYDSAIRRLSEAVGEDIGQNQAFRQALQRRNFGVVKGFNQEMQEKLRETLTEGMSQQRSYTDIRQDIREEFSVSKFRSEAIARSEVIRTNGEAMKDSVSRANTVNKLEWIDSTKESVCEICKPMDGNTYEPNEAPTPIDDTHPLCECGLVPVIDDE